MHALNLNVDTVIVIPNHDDGLLANARESRPPLEAFPHASNVLQSVHTPRSSTLMYLG